MKIEFSRKISENPQISGFTKIRPIGAELFHADRPTEGQTGMTKQIAAFFFAILRKRLKIQTMKSVHIIPDPKTASTHDSS
jgi:hypothetical protein